MNRTGSMNPVSRCPSAEAHGDRNSAKQRQAENNSKSEVFAFA
jgi:hypothetical protein